MKIYQKIIISISILIAVVYIILMMNSFLKTLFVPPTEEEYSLWKEYSNEIAKSWSTEVITDEEVRPSYVYDDVNKEMIVEIYSYKREFSLKSIYPVSSNAQDGKLCLEAEFENVEYKKAYNPGDEKILWISWKITVYILLGTFFGAVFYFLAKAFYKKIIMKINKKQN